MKEEIVSIIMPAYNSRLYIQEAIESVLLQSYPHWELLITDDCSSDNTQDICRQYAEKDNRIKYFFLEKNSGVAMARNHSIARAEGRYLAFLDSDDQWPPYKLSHQLAFMQQNGHALSFTAYQWMSDRADALGKIVTAPTKINYKGYLKNTIIGCLTVMIDLKTVQNIEFPNIKTSQDMALWLNLLKQEKYFYGLNEPLAFYRKNPKSNTSNKRKAALGVWHVYRQQEQLSFFSSLYNFTGYALHAFLKRV